VSAATPACAIIVLRRVEDTNHLAIDYDWKASLHLDEASRAGTAARRPWLIASSSASLGFLNKAAVLALLLGQQWRAGLLGPGCDQEPVPKGARPFGADMIPACLLYVAAAGTVAVAWPGMRRRRCAAEHVGPMPTTAPQGTPNGAPACALCQRPWRRDVKRIWSGRFPT
jgi:hypothetical protein